MLKRVHLGFFIGIVILIIDALLPLLLSQRAASIRATIDATETTRNHLHELLSAYKDAETGQRGYMLTGEPAFLEPYTTGRATARTLLPKLEPELQNHPQQAQRFRELLDLDREEAAFLQERIKQRSDTNWAGLEYSERGKKLMDGLREKIAALNATERDRIDQLLREVKRIERWSSVSLIAITALDLALFALIYLIMARSLFAERAAKEAVNSLNRNLAEEIALRTQTMQRFEQQSSRLNQIVEMQTALAEAQLDIEAFINAVAQRVIAITPAVGAVVEMIEGDDMVYKAASGSMADYVGFRLPRKGSLSGLCVAKGEVLIADDTRIDPRVNAAACEKLGARSMIVAPLLRSGKPIGVLKLVGSEPRVLDADTVQTLRLIAGSLGAALGTQVQFQKNQTLLTERGVTLTALKRELQRREEYEKKLLDQQKTLHTITNAIPALVVLIDANERYRYCNNEYEKTCGLSADKIIGRSLREFMGDELYLESKPYFDRALAGEPVIYENDSITAVGPRHHECHLIPQFDDGAPAGFYLVAWNVTERKTQEIEWQSRASIDELTGLLNRAFFTEALRAALSRNLRANTAIAVLYLDVDRFKHINDTYGHAAGDALLKAFAAYLKQSVRQSDIVGRLGGDEFCIMLDDIKTRANAIAVAQKILAAVRAPVVFENFTLTISTSIGIAFASQPQLGSEQLIAIADTALYKAKQQGRDGYAIETVAREKLSMAAN